MAAIAAGVITLAVVLLVGRGFLEERYLVWQVEHGDPETQARALDKLVSLESPAALPFVIQRFAANLRARHMEDSRLRRPYARIPDRPSFSQLTAPFVQLHGRHKSAANLALEAALSDPRASVRAAACYLISVLGSETEADSLAQSLIQVLKADPDDEVLRLACNALGDLSVDSRAVRIALENKMREEIPPITSKIHVRNAAARALRMIRRPQNASESE
jgi:HEAT repeat protein